MRPTARQAGLDVIDSFDRQVGTLGHTVAQLDAVWAAESWNADEQDRFRREWGRLEETYAGAVERRQPFLTDGEQERIAALLRVLRGLLEQADGLSSTT
jgi:hypothetical protein